MTLLRAVLFDMDGLMLDTMPIYERAWLDAGRALGYVPAESLHRQLQGRSSADCESILQRHYGNSFPIEEFRRNWRQRWDQLVTAEGVAVLPGTEELLSELENAGGPLAIATSANDHETELSLRAAGLGDRIETVVTVDDVARGKPAPDVFLEGAHRLAVPPSQCLVLEDSDAGIQAAAAAGMPAIMVPDSNEPSDEARNTALRIVASLHEARPIVRELLSGTRSHC